MARLSKAKKSVDVAARTVTFAAPNGESFVAELDKIPTAIITRLALHGLSQKGGDAYAGDVPNPIHEARAVYNDLLAGNWSTRTEGGVQRFTLLAEALAVLKHADVAACAAKLEEMDDDEVSALRSNPTVKAEMEKIKATRAVERAKAAEKSAGAGVEFEL